MGKVTKIRCSICRLDQKLCVCDFLPHLPTLSLPVTMIFHSKEWPKPTNTGHFIEKILPRVQRLIYHRGEAFKQFSADVAAKVDSERPILIFPDPHAAILGPEDSAFVKSNGLVFLDGTWIQAQQMLKRNPILAELPRRRLAPPIRHAMLWREDLEHGMATYEAVAWALSIFYPDDQLQAFWRFIRVRTQRIEWLRGLRDADSVEGGIPLEVLQTRHLAHN